MVVFKKVVFQNGGVSKFLVFQMVVLNMVAIFVWKIFIADFPVYLRLKKTVLLPISLAQNRVRTPSPCPPSPNPPIRSTI